MKTLLSFFLLVLLGATARAQIVDYNAASSPSGTDLFMVDQSNGTAPYTKMTLAQVKAFTLAGFTWSDIASGVPTSAAGYGITNGATIDAWGAKTPYAGTVTVTTGKTFNASNSISLAGTDGSTLNIGAGGTLGTAAYTAASAYDALSIGTYNVDSTYNAYGDAGTFPGVVAMASSPTITFTNSMLFPIPIGAPITVYGAGSSGADLTTTIVSSSSVTMINLAVAASTTVTGASGTLPNGSAFTNGSMTSGSNLLTLTTPVPVNLLPVLGSITVNGAGASGANLTTTIAQPTNTITVPLTTAASTAVTNASGTIGGVAFTTATISSGSLGFVTITTSPRGPSAFSSGAAIVVNGAGVSGATLSTTVAASPSVTSTVVNPSPYNTTSLVLGVPVSTSLTSGELDFGHDDTTAIQAAINAAEAAGGGVVQLGNKMYRVTSPLIINSSVTIAGRGLNSLYGSINGGTTIENFPTIAPLYAGSAIVQTTAGDDILDVTAVTSSVNLRDFALRFSEKNKFSNTGTGINCLPPGYTIPGIGSFIDDGIQQADWHNIAVYGGDGQHYGIYIANESQCVFTNLFTYGGGGLELENNGANDSGDIYPAPYSFANQICGNTTFSGVYIFTVVGSTTTGFDGLHLRNTGSGGFLNMLTFVGCQVGNYSGLRVSPAPNSNEDILWVDDNSEQIKFYNSAFESGFSQAIRLPSGAMPGFLMSSCSTTANTSSLNPYFQISGHNDGMSPDFRYDPISFGPSGSTAKMIRIIDNPAIDFWDGIGQIGTATTYYTTTPYTPGTPDQYFEFGTYPRSTSTTFTPLITFDNVGDGTFLGNLAVDTAGKGLQVKEGSNAKQGTATLVAGTVTVSDTAVTANSRIFLTEENLGTVTVPSALAVTARTSGTSFTITSSAPTDTSSVGYEIFEPAP